MDAFDLKRTSDILIMNHTVFVSNNEHEPAIKVANVVSGKRATLICTEM
jgi:hypothetical protein